MASAPPAGSATRIDLPPAIALLRPWQWAKNAFVLAPLPAALARGSLHGVGSLWLLCLAFCLAASSVYVVNDLVDRDRDRRHPVKRQRPLVAGAISPAQAAALAVGLTAGALAIGWQLDSAAALWLALYLVLSHAYSLGGKHVPYLDVLLVGLLYALRVAAGYGVVAPLSGHAVTWAATAGLLATAVEVGRRYGELRLLSAAQTRPVLRRYTAGGLERSFVVISVLTVGSYCWASWPRGIGFTISVLLVAAGMARYWQLHRRSSRDAHPQQMIFGDPQLRTVVAVFVLWFACSAFV